MAGIPDSRRYDTHSPEEHAYEDAGLSGEVTGPTEEVYLNGRRISPDDPVIDLVSAIGRANPKVLLGGAALLLGGLALAAFLSSDENEDG